MAKTYTIEFDVNEEGQQSVWAKATENSKDFEKIFHNVFKNVAITNEGCYAESENRKDLANKVRTFVNQLSAKGWKQIN